LVNVVLNLFLIPRYGFLGAAGASVVSEVVVATLNFHYVNHLVAHTNILRSLARPFVAAAVTGVGFFFLREFRLYVALPVSIILYVAALLAFRAFSPAEVRRFAALVRELLSRGRRETAVMPPAPLWESRED